MITTIVRRLIAPETDAAASTDRESGARLIRGFRLPTGGQMLGLGVGAAMMAGAVWYGHHEYSQYRHRELADAVYRAHGMPKLADGSSVRGFKESWVPGTHGVTFTIRYADGSQHKEPLKRKPADVEALKTLQLNDVHVPATASDIQIGATQVTYMVGSSKQTQALPEGFNPDKKSVAERAGDRMDQARGQLGDSLATIKDRVGGATDRATDRATDSVDYMKDRAHGAGERVKGWFHKDKQQ